MIDVIHVRKSLLIGRSSKFEFLAQCSLESLLLLHAPPHCAAHTIPETLTFLDHAAPEHRRLLKTTNSMEHDHAEVRRRSRVVRIFPNESSLIRLLGALAIERNEQWMERRYMVFKPDQSTQNEEVTQVA